VCVFRRIIRKNAIYVRCQYLHLDKFESIFIRHLTGRCGAFWEQAISSTFYIGNAWRHRINVNIINFMFYLSQKKNKEYKKRDMQRKERSCYAKLTHTDSPGVTLSTSSMPGWYTRTDTHTHIHLFSHSRICGIKVTTHQTTTTETKQTLSPEFPQSLPAPAFAPAPAPHILSCNTKYKRLL